MTKTVYKVWRTASVLLPDRSVRHRQLVFVTSDGLELFADRTEEPAWSAPVDFTATREPTSARHHVGVDIVTTEGTVVITPTGGCACGSRMKNWYPEWANRVAAWPREDKAS